MNKDRRKRINELKEQLENIQSAVEDILYEEQEYLDNIPENLQGSERYEIAEAAVDELECVVDKLSDAIDSLESAAE